MYLHGENQSEYKGLNHLCVLFTTRYSVNKFDEGFTVDVELEICIPVQDRHVCFPNGQPIHLIENEHIPLCNLGQGGSEGI